MLEIKYGKIKCIHVEGLEKAYLDYVKSNKENLIYVDVKARQARSVPPACPPEKHELSLSITDEDTFQSTYYKACDSVFDYEVAIEQKKLTELSKKFHSVFNKGECFDKAKESNDRSEHKAKSCVTVAVALGAIGVSATVGLLLLCRKPK